MCLDSMAACADIDVSMSKYGAHTPAYAKRAFATAALSTATVSGHEPDTTANASRRVVGGGMVILIFRPQTLLSGTRHALTP